VPKSDLNALQLQMISCGLITEEEVLDMIEAKKNQARLTRQEVSEIMRENNCSKTRAFEILKKKRRDG